MAAATAGTPQSRFRMPVVGGSPASLSPASSAESNFRELDDAFLQTQTRIWLGEVLQVRFDEDANIGDILADGELLFEVSEIISRMLPTLAVDETHAKLNEWKSIASSKSTRRYMPYYKVGAFLRMCKNLGLDSIDIFTPSDVVEKRNTRKVCMCIRTLSKKVRSRDLNVPDFDCVTCTLAMPTDKVQYIRKSLEQSQSSSSFSVESDSEKVSRIRYWQRMSNSPSSVSNVYSDDCDDAESISMVSGSRGSSNHTCDATSPASLNLESRGDEADVKLHLNMDLEEADVEDEYLSPAESVGSAHSEYYSDQELSSVQSSTCHSPRVDGKFQDVDGMEHGFRNVDVNHVPIDLEDTSWDIKNDRNGSLSDDEIGDAYDRRDEGKTGFDACSSRHNMHMENWAHPSEIECECDNTEVLCCLNPTPVVDRESNFPYEFAVEDDFCASEAPLSESESFEEEAVACENDIGRMYSSDVCAVEVDFCADETPASKFRSLDEQMTTEEETVSNGLILDSGKSHSDDVGNAIGLSCESGTHSSEVSRVGENSGNESLDYVETTPKDVVSKVKLHAKQSLCTSDSSADVYCPCTEAVKSNSTGDDCLSPKFPSESCRASHLLTEFDAIISANIYQSTENEREEFDEKLNNLDHTERCVDDSFMPVMDLGSFPSMIRTTDGEKRLDKVFQDPQQGYENVNVMAESTESRPIIIEETREGSEDHDVPAESVIGYDESTNMEVDASCVHSYPTTLGNLQQEADSPRTEDAVIKDNLCLVTMEKSESENVEEEDNNKEIQLHKPRRKLLKSIVKGTALVGIAVFLLHLRKNIKPNLPKEKQQPAETVTKKPAAKPSSEKIQKAGSGNTSSVYPAQKLCLGI